MTTNDKHKAWLDSLDLDARCIYDRAYGKAFYEGCSKQQCRNAGMVAVQKRQGRKSAYYDDYP